MWESRKGKEKVSPEHNTPQWSYLERHHTTPEPWTMHWKLARNGTIQQVQHPMGLQQHPHTLWRQIESSLQDTKGTIQTKSHVFQTKQLPHIIPTVYAYDPRTTFQKIQLQFIHSPYPRVRPRWKGHTWKLHGRLWNWYQGNSRRQMTSHCNHTWLLQHTGKTWSIPKTL